MTHDETLGLLARSASTAWLMTGGALLVVVAYGLFELWWWRKGKDK